MTSSFRCRFLLALAAISWQVPCPGQETTLFHNRHVLVVGIDGCRPDGIAAADAPRLKGLMEHGAFTRTAVAGGRLGTPTQQPTVSGPGWASILTGVWIDKHNVSNNDFTGQRFNQYPHFFQRIKELEPAAYLSSIASWVPIDTAIVGTADAYTDFRGQGKGATYAIRDLSVRDQAVAHLASTDPQVLFLHFDQVDGAGHGSGFTPNNAQYRAAIANVDAYIGDVLDAIDARPKRADESWLTIVTTDHGGIGTSHGGQSTEERDIFFIVSGDGVSPREVDETPGHTAVPPTVMKYLGLPIAGFWGWEEAPFGLPPYTPANLRAESGIGRDIVIRWQPPAELKADGLALSRNGKVIAELPLTANQFVDTLPPVFAAVQLVYSLEVRGAAGDIPPLQVTTVPRQSLGSALALSWPLDHDPLEADVHGTIEKVSGAYQGGGVKLGAGGWLMRPLGEELTFGRFTDFSISVWIQLDSSGAEGTLMTNKAARDSFRSGWWWSLTSTGEVRWNLADGVRQASLTAPADLLRPNAWQHLLISVDRPNAMTLYVDGELVGSESIATLHDSDGDGFFALGNDTLGTNPLSCTVDDLRIWRRALTPGDVATLYGERAAPSAWLETHFDWIERLSPDLGGWLGDPDGDSRPNLAEYATGSLPKEADDTPILRVDTDETGLVSLRYRQRGDGEQGIHYFLETSTTLHSDSWLGVDATSGTTRFDYAEGGWVEVRWSPNQNTPPAFYRLRFQLGNENVAD